MLRHNRRNVGTIQAFEGALEKQQAWKVSFQVTFVNLFWVKRKCFPSTELQNFPYQNLWKHLRKIVKCKRGHGVAALNLGALTVTHLLFSSWPLPVPSPQAASWSPQPAMLERAELKSRGTRGPGAGQPEGENEGPVGLVSRRRRRRRGMEPLRVLELYSGIGGMHQALRGESVRSAPPFIPSELRLQGRAERREARGGDRGREELGCLGNPPSRATFSSSFSPSVLSSHPEPCFQGQLWLLRGLSLSVCESWSARLGYKSKLKWSPQSSVVRPLPRANPQFLVGQSPRGWASGSPPLGEVTVGEGRSPSKSGLVTRGSSKE